MLEEVNIMYENLNFVFFDSAYLNQINFAEVLETDASSVLIGVDGRTFVNYIGSMPTSVINLPSYTGPFTYEQFLQKLDIDEYDNWNSPLEGDA